MRLEDIDSVWKRENNGRFDYAMNELEIWTDTDEDLPLDILDHIRSLGFRVGDMGPIDFEKLKSYEDAQREIASRVFTNALKRIDEPIDRETLLHYSEVENPQLVEQLKEDRPIEEILREEFMRVLFNEGNVSVSALDRYIASECEGLSHVFVFLRDTQLASPLLVTPSSHPDHDNMLAYHPMGRNGKIYGLSGPIYHSSGISECIVNATPFRDLPDHQLVSYVMEILNHEMAGHLLLDLDDHNRMPPDRCLMATKRSDAEYVRASQTPRGLYLCDGCKTSLPTQLTP